MCQEESVVVDLVRGGHTGDALVEDVIGV